MKYKHVIVVETEHPIQEFEDSMSGVLAALFHDQVKDEVFICSEVNQPVSVGNNLFIPNATMRGVSREVNT